MGLGRQVVDELLGERRADRDAVRRAAGAGSGRSGRRPGRAGGRRRVNARPGHDDDVERRRVDVARPAPAGPGRRPAGANAATSWSRHQREPAGRSPARSAATRTASRAGGATERRGGDDPRPDARGAGEAVGGIGGDAPGGRRASRPAARAWPAHREVSHGVPTIGRDDATEAALAVRLGPVPQGARALPDRRDDRDRHGRRHPGRVHDRLVHVGVARPAARRLPADGQQRHVAGDGAGRQVLRQRPARRPGRRCAGASPRAASATTASTTSRGPTRRPAARSSRASARGSTARSSTSSSSATTTWSSAGSSTSTTTPTRTPRSSSSRAPSAASWPPTDRMKLPRDWVSLSPNGIGHQKPNHYKEMVKVAWKVKGNRRKAWRILSRGRLRRVRARCRRLPRLDARRRPPVHDPPAPARGQLRRAVRPLACSATSRGCATSARPSCASSAGSPTRCVAGGVTPASTGSRGTRRWAPSPTASAPPAATARRST